jgi:hypothetical protein
MTYVIIFILLAHIISFYIFILCPINFPNVLYILIQKKKDFLRFGKCLGPSQGTPAVVADTDNGGAQRPTPPVGAVPDLPATGEEADEGVLEQHEEDEGLIIYFFN